MSGTYPVLVALVAKYGDARVLDVIATLQAQRAAERAAEKARRS